jgi:hypothetical protein
VNESTIPAYTLTNLTDEQWEKQLAAQQEMQAAELDSRKEVELEKLRNERDLARGRRDLIKSILGGLAVFLIVFLLIGGGIYAIQASSQRSHDKAIQCIKANGKWIDEGTGEGSRCER